MAPSQTGRGPRVWSFLVSFHSQGRDFAAGLEDDLKLFAAFLAASVAVERKAAKVAVPPLPLAALGLVDRRVFIGDHPSFCLCSGDLAFLDRKTVSSAVYRFYGVAAYSESSCLLCDGGVPASILLDLEGSFEVFGDLHFGSSFLFLAGPSAHELAI